MEAKELKERKNQNILVSKRGLRFNDQTAGETHAEKHNHTGSHLVVCDY